MKKKVLNSIKMIALLVFVVFLYAFSSSRNANRKLQAVAMRFENSTNLLTARKEMLKEINHFVEAKKTKKGAITNSVLKNIETRLATNKLIDNASVYLSLDDTLFVAIKQKEPIARIVSTSSYYLDTKGKKIPLSKNYTVRVPLVYGSFSADELLKIKELLDNINQDKLLKKQIVTIIKNGRNEYEMTTRLGNQRVIFGKLTKMPEKLKKLSLFYGDAWKKKRLKQFKTINLKYHHQIICKKI